MKTNRKYIKSLNDSRLIQANQLFDGAILQLYVNQLENEVGQIVEREIIHHQPAVAILAEVEEKIILVKQYRPAVAENVLELPAGLLDYINGEFESALSGAKRELEEEVQMTAHKWQQLQNFYVSPGFLDEEITLFYATDLEEVANPLPRDEDEHLSVVYATRKEVAELLRSGSIKDLKTLYGLTLWYNHLIH